MRFVRHALIAAGLAAAVLASASAASAGEAHADGSATTQEAACKLALTLARTDVSGGHVTASHCECLENKADSVPWSCTGFVSYR